MSVNLFPLDCVQFFFILFLKIYFFTEYTNNMKHHFQPILLCNMIFKSEIENPMRKKNVGCFFFPSIGFIHYFRG